MLSENWEQQPILHQSPFCQRAALAARPATFWGLKPKTVFHNVPALDPQQRDAAFVLQAAQDIRAQGGRAFIVGGYVRDCLLGIPSKDLDVEVFGLSADQLKDILSTYAKVDCIGEQFGVLLVHGYEVDWSLPRKDSKAGRGHRGIQVHTDPHLSYAEAARRRDLCMNAIMWDPLSSELIDPYDGLSDLHCGRLRAVDADLFGDDPLRALRVVRMAAVFGFLPDQDLFSIMRAQDLSELSRERLWAEWEKIILHARLPSLALLCLEDSGLISYFPELAALRFAQQDPEWHPEGDVYVHTAMVMDASVALRNGEREHDLALGFGALCHDLGKAPTTLFEDGRWRSKGHDVAGIPLTETFLNSIQSPHGLIKQVQSLVENHLKPISLQKGAAGPAAYRRLARSSVDSGVHLKLLAEVCEADHRGRTTVDAQEQRIPYIHDFYAQIEQLELSLNAPEPIVLGRHLLELGYKPGPQLGLLLKQCFEYQLEHGVTLIQDIVAAVLPNTENQ